MCAKSDTDHPGTRGSSPSYLTVETRLVAGFESWIEMARYSNCDSIFQILSVGMKITGERRMHGIVKFTHDWLRESKGKRFRAAAVGHIIHIPIGLDIFYLFQAKTFTSFFSELEKLNRLLFL